MVTDKGESVIKLARRQVIQGLKITERQRIFIQRLSELGRDTREAEHGFELFGHAIAILERQLANLEHEREGGP